MAEQSPTARTRIIDATLRCALKFSLQRTTLEDIAKEAGVSRATIYRHFAGGRDDVISSTVSDQVDEFFVGLATSVAAARDLEELLVTGLIEARRQLERHALFQRVMAVEPEILLPWLTTQSERIHQAIASFLLPHLGAHGGAHDEDSAEQADYMARLFMSCVESSGSWNLDDRDQVGELVRRQFLVR